ncbi:MAG: site-specific integrase [Acidobacteriota bacterium]
MSETLKSVLKKRRVLSPFIFCDEKGRPHDSKAVSMAFRRACKKAGVENLRLHDLRHDFASNLLQSGVDIYTVRELLGHKDLRMTVRYCHLPPENLRQAVSVLDAKESGYSLVTVGENKRGCIAATP